MRRRQPHLVQLSRLDRARLDTLLHNGKTQQRIARRARILLAMSDPTTVVEDLARSVGQARNSIWSVCRRYEQWGVDAVFDAPRSGRPRELSPPAAGPN